MEKRCIIDGCVSNHGAGGTVQKSQQFHEFPKNAIMMETWIKSIVLQNKQSVIVAKNMKICSKHFEPHMFESSNGSSSNATLLKPQALPTIFPENTADNIETITIKEEHLVETIKEEPLVETVKEEPLVESADKKDESIKCNGDELTIYEEIEYIDDDSDDDSIAIINDDPLTTIDIEDDDDDDYSENSNTSPNGNLDIIRKSVNDDNEPYVMVLNETAKDTYNINFNPTINPKVVTVVPQIHPSSSKIQTKKPPPPPPLRAAAAALPLRTTTNQSPNVDLSRTLRYPGDVKVETLTGGVHLKRAIATFEKAIINRDEKIKRLKKELSNSDAEIKKLKKLIDAERYKELVSKMK